jgi:ribosomal protein L11 methyltransferase
MFSLRLKCAPGAGAVEFLSAELREARTPGIRELDEGDSVCLIAAFETNELRPNLLRHFANYEVSWSQEDSTDWVEATHRAWPARVIGQRIFLAPPWRSDETPTGRLRVIHNPGLACGTGEHPCTQLALAALETPSLAGKTVVDIGTGSSLLAIAALRLGATLAIGTYTHEAALRAKRENFALNDLPHHLVVGSAGCLRDGRAAVTIANISATVLLSIADQLLRITGPHGQIVLTGFTAYELSAVQQDFNRPCGSFPVSSGERG